MKSATKTATCIAVPMDTVKCGIIIPLVQKTAFLHVEMVFVIPLQPFGTPQKQIGTVPETATQFVVMEFVHSGKISQHVPKTALQNAEMEFVLINLPADMQQRPLLLVRKTVPRHVAMEFAPYRRENT